MLLIKSTQRIRLQQQALKILKLSTAINGFLFVSTTSEGTEKLVHVDREGRTLWQRHYKDSVDTFGMFNEREAIALNVGQGTVEVVDLLTHSVRSYPHTFSFEDTASMDIFVFNDSRLFCVVERGSAGDHRLFLTYYAYESENIRQISAYRSSEDEWSYGQEVARANNHSKVVWWKPQQESTIEFSVFSLQQDHSGQLCTVNVKNSLADKQPQLLLEIAALWQTAPHVYLLVCNSNRTGQPLPNNNLILDARKQLLREARFSFPDRWNKQLTNYFSLGEVSAFHTFSFEKGDAVCSPIYYVNNEREEVIAVEEWQATNRINFYIPGFDTSTIIEAEHDNGQVDEVTVTTKRLMTAKEMYLHFMLHIHEDFDDDLLQDAVELLTET